MIPVALITLAAGLFAAAILCGIRAVNLRRNAPREPSDKEPASLPTTPRRWWPALRLHVLRTPKHEGATERWSPAGDLAGVGQSPELVPVLSEVEIRWEVHEELDQMMADFRHDLDHILDGVCDRLDPLWRRFDTDTGQFDRAALDAMLAENAAVSHV